MTKVVSAAPSFSFVAIVDPNSRSSSQVLLLLKEYFPLLLVVNSDQPIRSVGSNRTIFLAIGPAALKALVESDTIEPIVSLFTSSEIFQRIVRPTTIYKNQRLVTAVYAETSASAQCEVIAATFRRPVSLGVLIGRESVHLEAELKRAAKNFEQELFLQRVQVDKSVVQNLIELPRTDAVLLVPDSTIYTQNNLRAVLESTYRRGIPVFGFSASTVAAGTLAAAFSTIDDVISSFLELINRIETNHNVEPIYPSHWRVTVNEQVAKSLNIPIPNSLRSLSHTGTAK